MNEEDLVMLTVSGEIADPTSKRSPYRIGQDGVPRILPGTGGIAVNQRVGDRCVGLAADHVEPGVSVKNNRAPPEGDKQGPNLALNTYACVGNSAIVVDGPCKGARGVVTGKHGGVNTVLLDFPARVLKRLQNGNRVQIYGYGLGLRFPDHPKITAMNCAPRLIRRWGVRSRSAAMDVPVTHLIPAGIMGSGIGRNNAVRGDYDIQLFDPQITRRLKLDRLRYGDLVAVIDADNRFGRSYRRGFVSIGIVIHSDSTVSGHGPGIVTLLVGDARHLRPLRDSDANLANILRLRRLPPPTPHATLIHKERVHAQRARPRVPQLETS